MKKHDLFPELIPQIVSRGKAYHASAIEQTNLAILHLTKYQIPNFNRDYKVGLKYLTKAAQRKWPQAEFMLSLELENQKNEDTIIYLERAAGRGYAPAQYELGKKFVNEAGYIFEDDFNYLKGRKLLQLAAK